MYNHFGLPDNEVRSDCASTLRYRSPELGGRECLGDMKRCTEDRYHGHLLGFAQPVSQQLKRPEAENPRSHLARVSETKDTRLWELKISETFEIFPCELLATPCLFFPSDYK